VHEDACMLELPEQRACGFLIRLERQNEPAVLR